MVTEKNPNQRPPDLFTAFPATAYDTLIVRYPDRDGSLAYAFAEAAERLAESYVGRPSDDALLLPYLFLYRHACELNLKDCITQAAFIRRIEGHADPELAPAEVATRLRKHGHRIMALFEELDRHLVALKQEPMPRDVRRIHNLLSNTDPRGESFRYAAALPGQLPNVQDNVDFAKLRAALKESLNIARAAADVLDHVHEGQQEYLAYRRELEAEMANEMNDEARAMEAEMAAEWQDYY